MQIDLSEIQKLLAGAGCHLSLQLRDDHGRLIATPTHAFRRQGRMQSLN